MKALLRDKQIFWPHFKKGIYFVFFGAILWFLNNFLGYGMIGYGIFAWSIPEILLGGNELETPSYCESCNKELYGSEGVALAIPPDEHIYEYCEECFEEIRTQEPKITRK